MNKTYLSRHPRVQPSYSRRMRHSRRLIQVRRQKIALICAGALLLICGFAALFSKNFSGPALTINASCEAYRPQVEETAAIYDMTQYTDLILALMMQESSGSGPDVLQSSEGAYNTLYPRVPGGITDVSYSIECGIQELKYALEKAQVKGPDDLKRIRLALQAYNFGADAYFRFLDERGITSWSEESAQAFAQYASGGKARTEDDPYREHAGPWDYGDQRYPEHVLRYYHP